MAIIPVALAAATFAVPGQRTDNLRIAVKRGTDPGAAKIPTKPKPTSIDAILRLARPVGLRPDLTGPAFQKRRSGEFENSKWLIDANVVEVAKRPDGDIYCVIQSKSGARTVIEAPDPAVCAGSYFLAEIKRVRKILSDRFHPTGQPLKVNIRVQVVGVGLFGYEGKGQGTSRANGARIMPVLGIKFQG